MGIDLVSPVSSDFIKDWPFQNGVNCDRIDEYAGSSCLTTHPIGTYTPALTGGSSDPALGAGEIKGYYYKIFDQIYSWGHFKFGSGFSAGSGDYIISLPFKVKTLIPISANIARTPVIGNALLWDESLATVRQPLTCQLRSTTTIEFGTRKTTAATNILVSNSYPITWAIDDGIKWMVRYQRDPT